MLGGSRHRLDGRPRRRPDSPGQRKLARRGVCNGAEECRAAALSRLVQRRRQSSACRPAACCHTIDPDGTEKKELADTLTRPYPTRVAGKLLVYAYDEAGKVAIRAGVDSIEHGSFLKPDTLAQMKAKGIYLVPTLLAGETVGTKASRFPPSIAVKAKAAFAARTEMFKNALKAGVRIAFGTDSAVSPHGQNAQEFGLEVSLGMTPAAASDRRRSSAAGLLGIAEARSAPSRKGKTRGHRRGAGQPLAEASIRPRSPLSS